MVLVVDADENDWNKEFENRESVSFLPTDDLLSMIDESTVPEKLLQKCIELDKSYCFEAIREIRTESDIRDLNSVSCGFHDAFISELKESEDSLYVLFDGIWGCKIEVWFKGDISYDISSRIQEEYDQYWFGSTVAIHDGFVYLIDDEEVSPEEIANGLCWFKARNMRYRVIPN